MGRALVAVIAILTFLACLAAGGALLLTEASNHWRSEILSDVTIQVRPQSGMDTQRLVSEAVAIASHSPGVTAAHAFSPAESQRLLEPWLGRGIDLSALPVPQIVVLHLADPTADLASLRAALAATVPQATLDDSRVWASRIGEMADAIVVLAVAIFLLMSVAMAIAIGFATRGAVISDREILGFAFRRGFRRLRRSRISGPIPSARIQGLVDWRRRRACVLSRRLRALFLVDPIAWLT